MNKKQRNRKIVAQNKRNRIINKRYSSTIKSLLKLFKVKSANLKVEEKLENKENLKTELKNLISRIYSILDKAVKKKVIHKNNAARKKSKVNYIFKQL